MGQSDAEAREAFKQHIGTGQRQVTSRHRGATKTWNVLHEDTGRVVGKQTEHWSDRVDGVAYAPRVRVKTAQTEEA